jgi:putative SOS response-associated peptidase YedK
MCGRFTNTATDTEIAEAFDATPPAVSVARPRFNICPTQPVIIVRAPGADRELVLMRWGLVPRWAKDVSLGSRMINARSETLAEKPAFRDAFRKRRCLVPVTGFFEWRTTANGKQPHLIRRSDLRPFALAGLWESWRSPEDGSTLETFTIITTQANAKLVPLHDRMPVILGPRQIDAWLAPETDAAKLQELLVPSPPEDLSLQPVSTLVNNPWNDSPACIEPIAATGA